MTEPRNVHGKAYVRGSQGFIPDVDGVIENAHHLDGDLLFAKFKENSLASHVIPLSQVRGSTGLVMTATPADSVWAELIAANVHGLTSNLADGGTKTAVGTVQFQIPQNYIAGQDIQVQLTCKLKSVTGTGVANNGSDIDLSAYLQSRSLATVGSDLCATAAQTFAALDTLYQKNFVITPTNVTPGLLLNLLITGRAIENDAGDGTLQVELFTIEVLIDESGAAS